ncbi:MAG: ribonuclease H-like domain-containing protein [Polyangiales bacterium]
MNQDVSRTHDHVFHRNRGCGQPVEEPEGLRFLSRVSIDSEHGQRSLRDAFDVASEQIAALAIDERFVGVPMRQALFIDTETTGLGRGDDTIPFLVGLGRMQHKEFLVEQWMMREDDAERAMLCWFSERLRDASAIVSFNGKSFDWPLLRARCLRHRVPINATLPHLDLLHVSRRIFRERLRSMRLSELEASVLGVRRFHDVSGAEIPERYLDFLDDGDLVPMLDVVEHNRLDLLALPALLGRMAVDYNRPTTQCDDFLMHSAESLGYARVAERNGDSVRMVAFCDSAEQGPEDRSAAQAAWMKAKHHRREGDLIREEEALIVALRRSDDDVMLAHTRLQLSKFYEHRKKDFDSALLHAAHTSDAEGEDASLRRVERLKKRLERMGNTNGAK